MALYAQYYMFGTNQGISNKSVAGNVKYVKH